MTSYQQDTVATRNLSILMMVAGFVGAFLMSTLLIARFVLKMLAVSAGDLTSLIFGMTETMVQPFVSLISPLTFSSGAVIEMGSLFPAMICAVLSGAFLWRLYLKTGEQLHVRCVHITPV